MKRIRGCDGQSLSPKQLKGLNKAQCNVTKSLYKVVFPSFIHRYEERKTEGDIGWLFSSIRLSFTRSHLNHPPPLSLCLICPFCSHIFALASVRAIVCVCVYECVSLCAVRVCVPMCVYVWLEELIPSARKCLAARIWS